MSEKEKVYIEAPDLPNVVQGDGRYLMTQLRRYLAAIAEQVNLANGFKANEEIGSSGIAPPPNFTLTFSVEGGVFKWSDPTYYNNLAYYEVRTNTAVGTLSGLLERTTNNYSYKMPVSSVGTAYLYAVLQDGTASNGSALQYSKKRPEKPQDINMSKNAQGTLINFTFIPLDCIGAHIYVNGIMYETQDNWMLYTEDADQISEIAVAYYDSFGEGEKGYLYCKIPQVQDFIVERNGAVLDFYWRSVGVQGAGYAVRASTTPSWENGLEIFKTELLKKKMEYPNTGDIYFLIKAYDEHGNFSQKASWFLLKTVQDQQKNVIVDFNEHQTMYTGNKVGTYYDTEAHGLRLSEGVFNGEYISAGHLPYTARARSWADYKIEGISNTDIVISDLDFSLLDDRAKTINMVGGVVADLDGVEIKTYIADKNADKSALIEAPLDEDLQTVAGEEPTEHIHCDVFDYARWSKGLKQDELTRLAYNLPAGASTFSLTFNIKITDSLEPSAIASIGGGNGALYLRYDDGLILVGSDGLSQKLQLNPSTMDIIAIGVSQSDTERTLYALNNNAVLQGTAQYKTIKAPPIGIMTAVRFNS